LEGKVNLLIRDLVPVTLKLTPKPFGIGALIKKVVQGFWFCLAK